MPDAAFVSSSQESETQSCGKHELWDGGCTRIKSSNSMQRSVIM